MIEKLLIPGVVAAAHHHGPVLKCAGEKRWENELRVSLNLLNISNAPTLRVVLGGFTIVARDGIAVVVATGDPVCKSLQRTLQRFAKKLAQRPAAA